MAMSRPRISALVGCFAVAIAMYASGCGSNAVLQSSLPHSAKSLTVSKSTDKMIVLRRVPGTSNLFYSRDGEIIPAPDGLGMAGSGIKRYSQTINRPRHQPRIRGLAPRPTIR